MLGIDTATIRSAIAETGAEALALAFLGCLDSTGTDAPPLPEVFTPAPATLASVVEDILLRHDDEALLTSYLSALGALHERLGVPLAAYDVLGAVIECGLARTLESTGRAAAREICADVADTIVLLLLTGRKEV